MTIRLALLGFLEFGYWFPSPLDLDKQDKKHVTNQLMRNNMMICGTRFLNDVLI